MKKINAIVRASKFEAVRDALAEKNIHFFSFFEIKGYGHAKGEHRTYRGAAYDIGYIARIELEIILSDTFVAPAIEAILSAAKTGEKGDGLITVTPIEQVINIRTGFTGSEAINS